MPGLLRAQCRQRFSEPPDARRSRGRPVRHQRPEGLDQHGACRRLGLLPGSHRSQRRQAQGHYLHPRGHEDPRYHHPAPPPDHGRGRVQRGLPRECPRARRQRGGQGQRGLGGGDHDPGPRARRPDHDPPHQLAHRPRAARRAVQAHDEAGPARLQGSRAAPEDRGAAGRRAVPPAQRLSEPDPDSPGRPPGARGLDLQALLEPGRSGAGRRGERDARPVLADRRSEPLAPDHGQWEFYTLLARGSGIRAGTSEILRNILGERVLGLPKD